MKSYFNQATAISIFTTGDSMTCPVRVNADTRTALSALKLFIDSNNSAFRSRLASLANNFSSDSFCIFGNLNTHTMPSARGKLYHCIQTKFIKLTAQQVRNTGLRYTKALCNLALCPLMLVYLLCDIAHQLRAHCQNGCFSIIKTQIREHIAARFSNRQIRASHIHGVFFLSRRVKLNTKCINHFYNCAKLWVALAREGFIQTFAANTAIFSQLRHATRTGDCSQAFSNKRRVIATLIQASLEVQSNVFISFKVISCIKTGNSQFFNRVLVHRLFLQKCNHFFRFSYITQLTGFIAATQQQHNNIARLPTINAIPAAQMKAQLNHAIKSFAVAPVSLSQPLQPCQNALLCDYIFQCIKPLVKISRAFKYQHELIVIHGLQLYKKFNQPMLKARYV